jgi:hypothetical protein
VESTVENAVEAVARSVREREKSKPREPVKETA